MRRIALYCAVVSALSGLEAAAQQVEEHARETIHVEAPGQYRPQSTPDLETAAREVVRRTNRFRKRHQRSPVSTSPELMQAANYFAGFMAEHDLYGHTADDARPADRARKFGYDFCVIAENIAYRFETLGFTTEELAKDFVKGWRESPEHRKNMLRRSVQQTGVAIARSPQTGVFYAVQMFGRPKSASIQFTVRNASPRTVSYQLAKRSFQLPPNFVRQHELCRPSKLRFKASPDAEPEQADRSFAVEDGDLFQIEPTGEETYRVSRQAGTAK